jgi:autotransporter-associated beta strand protein
MAAQAGGGNKPKPTPTPAPSPTGPSAPSPLDPYWDTSNTTGLQAGNGTWSTGTIDWNPLADGTGTRVVWTNGGDAVFQTSGTSTVTVSGTVTANSITFNGTGYTIAGTALTLTGPNITANVDATISAPLGGSVGLTKLGTGTLTLSGSNTYSGATLISAGTLSLVGTTVIPVNSDVTVSTGATLALNDSTVNGAYATIGSLSGGGTVDSIGSKSPTLTVGNNNSSSTFSGVLQDTLHALSLIKTGTGTLTLSGANTYIGGTTISNGTLQFAKTNSMPLTGTVTVSNGATLAVNVGGTNEWTNGTSGGGTLGGLIAGTGGQGTALQVSWTAGSVLGVDTTNASGGNFTYGGVIGSFNPGATNSVGLTKLGTGTLTLTNANTYTGATTVNAGTLLVNGSLASGSAVTVNNSGTLGGSGTITGSVTLNNSAVINAGTVGTVNTTFATGALTMKDTSILSVDMTSTTADKINVTGGISLVGSTVTLQLNIPNGTVFAAGTQFTLLNNITAGAISGTFSDAPTGTDLINGYLWTASYTGGDGNDFVLTAVPEPGTWVAAALTLGAVVLTQRRRLKELLVVSC